MNVDFLRIISYYKFNIVYNFQISDYQYRIKNKLSVSNFTSFIFIIQKTSHQHNEDKELEHNIQFTQKNKSQYKKIINKTHYVQIYETFYIQTIKQINEIQRIYTITHYDTIQNND